MTVTEFKGRTHEAASVLRRRVKVRVDLSVPNHSDIFAVGDTAAVTDQPGIPSTAP